MGAACSPVYRSGILLTSARRCRTSHCFFCLFDAFFSSPDVHDLAIQGPFQFHIGLASPPHVTNHRSADVVVELGPFADDVWLAVPRCLFTST